jgi:hypothetical protein
MPTSASRQVTQPPPADSLAVLAYDPTELSPATIAQDARKPDPWRSVPERHQGRNREPPQWATPIVDNIGQFRPPQSKARSPTRVAPMERFRGTATWTAKWTDERRPSTDRLSRV